MERKLRLETATDRLGDGRKKKNKSGEDGRLLKLAMETEEGRKERLKEDGS